MSSQLFSREYADWHAFIQVLEDEGFCCDYNAQTGKPIFYYLNKMQIHPIPYDEFLKKIVRWLSDNDQNSVNPFIERIRHVSQIIPLMQSCKTIRTLDHIDDWQGDGLHQMSFLAWNIYDTCTFGSFSSEQALKNTVESFKHPRPIAHSRILDALDELEKLNLIRKTGTFVSRWLQEYELVPSE